MKSVSEEVPLPWEQVYARKFLTLLRNTPAEQLKDVPLFPGWLWDGLRHSGRRLKDHVIGHLPRDSRNARRLRAWQWELYKASCPNWVPWVFYISERQWMGLFERKRPRRPTGSPLLADLPAERAEAENLFNQFCERWTQYKRIGRMSATEMPASMKPLLVGVARRLVLDPNSSLMDDGRLRSDFWRAKGSEVKPHRCASYRRRVSSSRLRRSKYTFSLLLLKGGLFKASLFVRRNEVTHEFGLYLFFPNFRQIAVELCSRY